MYGYLSNVLYNHIDMFGYKYNKLSLHIIISEDLSFNKMEL